MTPEEQKTRLKSVVAGMISVNYRANNLTFNTIAGNEDAKQAITEAIIMPEMNQIGVAAALKTVLLLGPPGTGKSLISKCSAGELEHKSKTNVTFYDVRLSKLISTWQGEPEMLVAELFESACANQPAIIFVDEIDSLTSKRSDNDGTTCTNLKSELLTSISNIAKESRVYVIGATNLAHKLDKAFVRRFAHRIYVGLPSVDERGLIFDKLMLNFPASVCWHNIDTKKLSGMTDGYSGDDIHRLVLTANYEAVKAKSVNCGRGSYCIYIHAFLAALKRCPPVDVSEEIEDLDEFCRKECTNANFVVKAGLEKWPLEDNWGCLSLVRCLLCGWLEVLCKST